MNEKEIMQEEKPNIGKIIINENAGAMDVLESMWGLVCNVSNGDWELQSEIWQEAAKRIREEYFALLKKTTTPSRVVD